MLFFFIITGYVFSVCCSIDNNFLFSGSWDKTINVWALSEHGT